MAAASRVVNIDAGHDQSVLNLWSKAQNFVVGRFMLHLLLLGYPVDL